MFDKKTAKALQEFYCNHLKDILLPFWLKNSIDTEFGGYYTCFDNETNKLISTDKYTWSQGRMIWVFSKLSDMEFFPKEERSEFLNLARSGVDFIIKNSVLENGNCAFVLDREGNPKLYSQDKEFDISFYADCFVILGLAKYALISGDKRVLNFTKKLYRSVHNRVQNNTFKSEPYQIPHGFRHHGPPMIMLNVSNELALSCKKLGKGDLENINHNADIYMMDIMDNFVADDHVLHEMIDKSNNIVSDMLIGRYVNPGHTIEDMWFVIHHAMQRRKSELIDKAAKIIKKTMEIGWDKEYGGLLLFADQNGGMPFGSIKGMEDDGMIKKILNDWDSKLWWPHSEALYTLLLAYTLTDDTDFYQAYNMVHDYTFKTFPNPNTDIGEWIQIRNRNGKPEQKQVALPVKDPFHVIRNVILIIELLNTLK